MVGSWNTIRFPLGWPRPIFRGKLAVSLMKFIYHQPCLCTPGSSKASKNSAFRVIFLRKRQKIYMSGRSWYFVYIFIYHQNQLFIDLQVQQQTPLKSHDRSEGTVFRATSYSSGGYTMENQDGGCWDVHVFLLE